MSQYIHDLWGPEQGFPRGQIHAITQTPDGYLWIGTETGLFRFDGINFRMITDQTSQMLISGGVLGLASDAEGSLWIRLESPEALIRYRDGVLDDPGSRDPWSYSAITAIARTGKGDLLAYASNPGAVVRRQNKFSVVADAASLPRSPVLSIAQTGDGDLWLGTRDAGLFRIRGSHTSPALAGVPDPKIDSLLPDGKHGLWIGTDNGVAYWNGSAATAVDMPSSLDRFQALAMTRDRDSNLWIGTDSRGLIRLSSRGVSFLDQPGKDAVNAVTAVFEDREGNIWIGSPRGVERLRDSAFLTYSSSEGMPSPGNGPIFVDSRNRTWFAPIGGGLYWLDKGKVNRFVSRGIDNDLAYSIAGSGDDLWVGWQHSGLTHIHFAGNTSTVKTFTTADGLAQNSVGSIYLSSDNSVWAGSLSSGVTRLHNGNFTTYTAADGLASNTVFSIAEIPGGATWFATPNGLSSYSEGAWRTYTAANGLPSSNVNCLVTDAAGLLWIGTTGGLAVFRGGTIETFLAAPAALHEQILGMAEDGRGALWFATSGHVLRVSRAALLSGSLTPADVRQYGLADGLQSTTGIRRHRSVVADAQGRVWFSLIRGLSVVDSSRAASNSVPVIAHVQSMQADGNAVDLRSRIRVAPGPQRIAFDYAGLNLSVPERVRFRYALDGYDSHWSAPSALHEAAYTNLGPGAYRFRVIAGNGDETWESPEATVAFVIERTFWQTYWFRAAIVAAFLMSGAAAYRFRMHQLTRQLNLLFEERLDERSRIAQELHDTLLQGLLSASIQLHVATDAVPDSSVAKPRLNRVLELMGQVIQEGRNAVRGLRSSFSSTMSLEQALSLVKEEVASVDPIDFRVVVHGQPRPLNPVLRDESYRIGREALVNAFRHSRGTAIEAEVDYSTNQLIVMVSDNGCGIDPQVLLSGRDGHWGIPGMRERAERAGGKLQLRSSAFSGTEVKLSVPSHIAFSNQPLIGKWRMPFRPGRQRRGKNSDAPQSGGIHD